MGSGEFPGKGFRKAAYFCNLQIAEKNRSFLPPRDFLIGATQPDSYTGRTTHSRGCGGRFYYGGPEPGPYVHRPLRVILWLLCFVFGSLFCFLVIIS
ncbi:hypothetical protein Bca4012_061619 [Brassica carinata]|uniref:Neprosin PEP catalytic domain-containing protein n=1 Tax=Brassica carinata TaxID=52824 RepID=A0A8X7QEP0_BRACI|nr:hypothetical protein Bca52824_062437 [Brassica carinata]